MPGQARHDMALLRIKCESSGAPRHSCIPPLHHSPSTPAGPGQTLALPAASPRDPGPFHPKEPAMSLTRPVQVAHVVYRTRRFEQMANWYKTVFDAKVLSENPVMAFLTFDDE